MNKTVKIEEFVHKKLGVETSGHDVYHCIRVRNVALKIAESEGNCDLEIVSCAALLHDITDCKICTDQAGARQEMIQVMKDVDISDEKISKILDIIDNISYKGAGVPTPMSSIEGKVVQDADRLDAIGAIGIARCFAYGGHVGNPIYTPNEKPVLSSTEEEYRNHRGSSISHFYEKLLLLKDRMQTQSGKRIAELRHQYMCDFLSKFFEEWSGADTI
ncbi:HD domain-containing protein [Histomonas meleagridis]|uniref:HD domain-containing protein n=1 Tax=Histomonas meleagridis TaxID=135588 RepID=UPI003559F3FA|nr:HD domain-containing protein [Histomonas meleagridis]KAH0799909.1 HD domain-containing protein [Histomonas meleagridis]